MSYKANLNIPRVRNFSKSQASSSNSVYYCVMRLVLVIGPYCNRYEITLSQWYGMTGESLGVSFIHLSNNPLLCLCNTWIIIRDMNGVGHPATKNKNTNINIRQDM